MNSRIKANGSNSKIISFVGVMTALEFVVMLIETYVFGILIPIAPPCILSLSIALTLSIFGEAKYMFIGGTIMGFCSFILAFILGFPNFMLPWNSILPRLFVGIVAYGVTVLTKKIFRKSNKVFVQKYLPYSLGAIFGTLTNTVLVLTALLLTKFIGMEDVVATFVAINFPLELVGSAILVPILVNAVRLALRIR